MKLFSKGPEKSIQEYISEAKKREGSIFLDVRTPLHELKKIGSVIPDQEAPVYVYCLSGARSRRSAALMGHMGYLDVTDMGGLLGQKVKLVR